MHLFSGGHDEVDFSTTGNKSYTRTDSYKKDVKTGQNIFNLSFDDTIIIFEDISENDYNSIFDNQTLNWYRQLHRDYGVVISCYVYYEDGEFNLSQVPDKYKDEFVKNSNWLRFGFHTLNGETDYKKGKITNDYIKTINQLKRIVGKQSIDNVIRLQMFQGSYKEIKQLSQLVDEPVKGLLTADDKRQSYYLNKDNSKYIYCHDEYYDSDANIHFFSTDFRTENVQNINSKLRELSTDSWNNQTGDLVIFSHEWALSMENKDKIEKVCKYADKNNYRFVFFEDMIK